MCVTSLAGARQFLHALAVVGATSNEGFLAAKVPGLRRLPGNEISLVLHAVRCMVSVDESQRCLAGSCSCELAIAIFCFFHVGEHYTVVHYFPSVLLFVTLADPLETAE